MQLSSGVNVHTLSPTQFLSRAAAIKPEATAIHHVSSSKNVIRRSYKDFARRASGLVNAAIDYCLQPDDIKYIFEHAEVDMIIVDHEFAHILNDFRLAHPHVPLLVDSDTDGISGPFDMAIAEGQAIDLQNGDMGWSGLETQVPQEDAMLAISYTSGTTSRPKGVVYTHRSIYVAGLSNVIESGLYSNDRRYKYLWILPMFHAMVAASPPSAALFEQMTALKLNPVHAYGLTETHGPITKAYYMHQWDELPADVRYQMMARQGHGVVVALPVRVIKPGLPEGELVDVQRDGQEIVIIIGSGLAGALLANGLIREGIKVHVYERYERNSKRDGFQIRLTLPAILGLRSCLTPEHLTVVVKNFGPTTGVKGEGPCVLHKDCSLLVDFSRFPAYGENVPINRGILWNALSEPVYEAVYLPGSRNQDDTQAGQEVTGKAYDESLSSTMVGLNVAKEIVPKGIQDGDNDVQWDFVAESVKLSN
ncbi:hypothetical protein ZTR_09118 [Talaromyces verruculosus]|nr:hypothetical protein ZTR_09118 [Talaromyces verruculosus]